MTTNYLIYPVLSYSWLGPTTDPGIIIKEAIVSRPNFQRPWEIRPEKLLLKAFSLGIIIAFKDVDIHNLSPPLWFIRKSHHQVNQPGCLVGLLSLSHALLNPISHALLKSFWAFSGLFRSFQTNPLLKYGSGRLEQNSIDLS